MNNPNNLGRGHAPAIVSGPVLQALAELRHATATQIAEHLGGRFTVGQVQRALSNARHKRLVCNNGIVRQKGVKGGAAMSTYWLPGDDPPAVECRDPEDLWRPNRKHRAGPMFASVWHYAQWVAANDSARQRA